jgi:subtilase family serine protease
VAKTLFRFRGITDLRLTEINFPSILPAMLPILAHMGRIIAVVGSRNFKRFAVVSTALAGLCWARGAAAEAPVLIHGIDETKTVELEGNTRPEANLANDRGALAANFALEHMQLLLKPAPETEAALDAFIDSLTDETSPNYHHWLTATEYGAAFGPSAADIDSVTAWLASHGFIVNGVSDGRTMIDFSGTAAQLREAFHADMHALSVRGTAHIANMSNPRIPAALAGVVEGIVSLNDFRPRPLFQKRPAYTAPLDGSTYYIVAPPDLATIYNFTPEFKAGISGKGETIAVIEDTTIYKAADWTTFRKTFGLSTYTDGKLTQTNPTGSAKCSNPGVISGNEGEAELDMEWASAAAPSATIEVASCADTSTTFGGLIALQNLVNSKTPPSIVSISYGECEVENGASQNAAYNTTYKQAAALGISVFVAAGDWGAVVCDAGNGEATHGINVSAFASTPYNVAVGGTDFGDTYAGTNKTYWSSKNSSTDGSALSYIPEIPWNDSCASTLVAKVEGYSTTYGSKGFCNSSTGEADFLTVVSGSGGPSGCATGKASTAGVVSGTCKGYAKPTWQKVLGNAADKVRDLPDVSLFAANGLWSHFYVYCDTDTADGEGCSGTPVNWSKAGGTSFASPIMAGIQALINEKHGKQGNPNPTLYKLAAAEYGTKGDSTCNSTLGKTAAKTCVFYDVTLGDMDVPCTGTHNCYKPSGTYGVLSTSNTAYKPAYKTGLGWDFATGIGSVDVANLVTKW